MGRQSWWRSLTPRITCSGDALDLAARIPSGAIANRLERFHEESRALDPQGPWEPHIAREDSGDRSNAEAPAHRAEKNFDDLILGCHGENPFHGKDGPR